MTSPEPAYDDSPTLTPPKDFSTEFVFVGPPKPVHSSRLVGRRIKNEAKFFVMADGGVLRPTVNVFREDRPGGLSVDVLWDPGTSSPAIRKRALTLAKEVCFNENIEIVGWWNEKVANLTRKEEGPGIQRVVHTPNQTNLEHGDALAWPFMTIDDVNDPERKLKATALAKLLCDYAATHGHVLLTTATDP